jgi:hypothetical protein
VEYELLADVLNLAYRSPSEFTSVIFTPFSLSLRFDSCLEVECKRLLQSSPTQAQWL